MKEKKIAIAVLLSMVLQAEAVRPIPQDDRIDEKTEVEKKVKKRPVKKEKEAPEDKHERKHEGGHHKDEPKKEKSKKVEPKKAEHKKHEIKHQDEKKKDAREKREEMLNKKRADLEKSIRKIEDAIADLESKKADAVREEDESKEVNKGRDRHLLNHGSVKVDHLTKEIKAQKEMLARKEDALAKLSNGAQGDKHKEAANRRALAKIYGNNQRDGRDKLVKIEDEIRALKAEEVGLKNKLEDDKPTYEKHIKARRRAETRHDSGEAKYLNKVMLVTESDRMKVQHLKEKRVREDLDAVRKKVVANDKARKTLAKELGTKADLKKEKHDNRTDQMIASGEKTRLLTQDHHDIKARKEEVGDIEKMEKKNMLVNKEMRRMEEEDNA